MIGLAIILLTHALQLIHQVQQRASNHVVELRRETLEEGDKPRVQHAAIQDQPIVCRVWNLVPSARIPADQPFRHHRQTTRPQQLTRNGELEMLIAQHELSVKHELLPPLCELNRETPAILTVVHAAVRSLRLIEDAQERRVRDEHGTFKHAVFI